MGCDTNKSIYEKIINNEISFPSAEQARAASNYRNSDEYQFDMIVKGIAKFATGQTGYQNPIGMQKITFKRLRPEFKVRLVAAGYIVEDTVTNKPIRDENGKQTGEEQVDSSEVRWGEETKMEVVK